MSVIPVTNQPTWFEDSSGGSSAVYLFVSGDRENHVGCINLWIYTKCLDVNTVPTRMIMSAARLKRSSIMVITHSPISYP